MAEAIKTKTKSKKKRQKNVESHLTSNKDESSSDEIITISNVVGESSSNNETNEATVQQDEKTKDVDGPCERDPAEPRNEDTPTLNDESTEVDLNKISHPDVSECEQSDDTPVEDTRESIDIETKDVQYDANTCNNTNETSSEVEQDDSAQTQEAPSEVVQAAPLEESHENIVQQDGAKETEESSTGVAQNTPLEKSHEIVVEQDDATETREESSVTETKQSDTKPMEPVGADAGTDRTLHTKDIEDTKDKESHENVKQTVEVEQEPIKVKEKEKPKLRIEHPKIYPRIEREVSTEATKPFTVEQLKSLYYNAELEHLDDFVDNFLKHINQDRHEFYELVLNYYRARNHLVNAEKDVESLRSDCDHYLNMVWTTVKKSVVVQGKCADKYSLSTDLEYDVAEFSPEALTDVTKTLKTIRNFAHDELSLHAYSAQLSRLQVESYIHELYRNVPQLRDIPHNAPVRAWLLKDRGSSLTEQIQPLRECIDVLFMFQRKPCIDDVFVKDTRSWLRRLVATLLRIATVEEHLWILNQILRCPAGVGKWAAGLVQVVPPTWSPQSVAGGQSGWGSPLLDHAVSVMATILLPIRRREELMYQLKAMISPTGNKENPWILIDSDGEEDEDPDSSWQYLQENDLVALLNQIPLADIFRHVLQIEVVNDIDRYDVSRTSENGMLKLFSFASCYIQLLGQGLQHFCLGRYRQLNKRIARIIKEIVLFVSDHWENFKSAFHLLPSTTLERLQIEYDQVFCRATSALLSAQRLGSWQFMADMPYNCVSMPMMWTLLWLMHYGYKDKCDIMSVYTEQQCQEALEDAERREHFENKLLTMPTSEAIYLLTTFSKMAASVSSEQKLFVHVITKEIYEISYISSHTREFCSKVGRELLSSIAQKHPFTLSFLLQGVQQTVDKIGMVSLYLFSELPLKLFSPTDADIILLRSWLLERPISSTEHQLARLVLQNMNWDVDTQNNRLYLDYALHQRIAITLVEMHQIHLSAKHIPGGGYLYDAVKPGQQAAKGSDEQQASNWSWEIVFRLKLHLKSRPQEAAGSYTVPDLNADPVLYPVQKSVKEQNSFASYVALVMTKYGHSTDDFCSDGFFLLSRLITQQQYAAAIHMLAHITPLFHKCVQYLTDNSMYIGALHSLVNGDNAKKSLLFNEFPGNVTTLLTNMIMTQVSPNQEGADSRAIEFWLEQLTHIPRWQHERNVLYVLDNLLQVSLTNKDATQKVIQFFNRITLKHNKGTKETGMLSSLVSWIATGTQQPSLIDGASNAEFSCYAYHVLLAETGHEVDCKLWNKIQLELYSNPTANLDQLIKKCASSLKMEISPSAYRLSIYRWAQQAIDMDVAHPILPLVWQRFFLLYLGRPGSEAGLPQRGGVGEKFFESTTNTSMLKRMKKQLTEAADHHHQCVTELDKRERSEVSGETSGGEDTVVIHTTPKPDPEGDQAHVFHTKLVKFYQTLLFWLDEPRLHDPNLYLPALPPQYEAERLLTLFHNQQTPWLEFMDYTQMGKQLLGHQKDWRVHNQFGCSPENISYQANQHHTATERILARLKSDEKRSSPPSLVQCKAPVPEVNPAFLTDKQSLLYALRSDLAAIIEYARLFSIRVSKHVAVDATFIELLPSLYRNEIVESEVTIQCTSSFNPTHRCKGPALIVEKHENKKKDEITGRKVDENRAESKQLMIESLLPPAQNVCSAAVHVENTISALIKLVQNSTNEKTRAAGVEVAISLFYHLSSLVSEDTRYYPPTRQFFSACIEMLGQEFIRNNPTQSQPLLQCILATPHLAGLLVPNFSPNATPELFITMYEDMINAPINQGPDVAFTLLTKFDVRLWLAVSKPAIGQRSALVEVIGRALATCGLTPSNKMALVFEVYRSHAQRLLLHQFPDHYGDILKLLLNGSASGQLKPVVWADFLQNIGCPCATEKSPAAAEEADDPDTLREESTDEDAAEIPLSIAQIKETLQWISTYFFQIRISSSDMASFGLYPGWSLYVTYISKFLGFMTRQLICKVTRAVRAGDLQPNQALLDIWRQINEVCAPWIQPLDNNGQVLSPWINSDAPLATSCVSMFTDVVLELYKEFKEILPDENKGVLNLVWTYYTSTLAVSGCPEHVLSVYHHHLPDLPWKQFMPDVTDLDLMIQLFHRKQNSSIVFLSTIVSVINWVRVIEASAGHQELVSVHVTLFHLLVSLSSNQDVSQVTSLSPLLKEAESFNWSFLDGTNYERVVTWFKDSCDPKCILADKISALGYLMNLLKVASGFVRTENMVLHPETPLKRAAYVRCIVQLVCRCSHLKDVKPDNFPAIITTLISDVETIVGTVMDMASQHQESVSLCSEVLNLLNNCNPQGKTSVLVMDTLTQWMMTSHSSILILPMVTASGRTLASVSQMTKIVESGIEAHFQQEHPEANAFGWGWVLGAVTVPEISHNEFLEECIKHGCYLTLFAYVLQKLPMSQSLQDEYKYLNYLITWSGQVKPRAENEAKLLLWFGKVVELVLRQLHYGSAPSLLNQTLQTFVSSLQLLGEDKSHSGLLGAIGLGKKSQLSLRFIARTLSVYLLSQMPNQNFIRSQPGAPGAVKSGSSTPTTPTSPGQPPTGPSAQASQSLSQLEALRNNKTYASLREHIIYAGEYTADPQHCMNDTPGLLVHLVKNLYKGHPFLFLLFNN